MAEEKNGKIEYQAQSPDEAALVSAARNFGFVFRERSPNSITIEVMGTREIHELLCILDFNNIRKRMSVVLRRNGNLRLYCKGADNVIYERLKNNSNNIMQKTQEHLNKFAGEGLRTLCLSFKDLEENYFNEWKQRHMEAVMCGGDDKDEKIDTLYEEIEKDMTLLGATAIEDKLQDGVPQTIANLSLAGIKLWVLTGDKQGIFQFKLLLFIQIYQYYRLFDKKKSRFFNQLSNLRIFFIFYFNTVLLENQRS